MAEELKKLALNSEELEDVAGKKPKPMTQEKAMKILKGHRFRFGLEGFEQYS